MKGLRVSEEPDRLEATGQNLTNGGVAELACLFVLTIGYPLDAQK